MPVQTFGFVPTGIVEHENDFFPLLFRHFLREGVEKSLKDFLVIVRHDEAIKIPALQMHCRDDVLANVRAKVGLSGIAASLDPFLPWPRITLETRFI